jgi:nicotinate dehydrogenase subunit B
VPTLNVNGVDRELSLEPDRSLLQVLREELGLTGAKYACGEGACGACTVLVDGQPVRSCVTPIAEAAGRAVATVEGLARVGELHPVQLAFVETAAMQCGFCTPGMVMGAVALLERTASPGENAIREAMQGNVCRCCAYPRILQAVRRAAELAASEPPDLPASAPAPADAAVRALPRPRRPWDLTRPEDRDFFEVLPPGLIVVVPPGAIPDAWSAYGGAWIHAGADGVVTAFTGKVEVGQDNRTALSALVAADLGVPVSKVRLVMGDTDLCPGDMGTFGSRSVADVGVVLRAAAAAARRLLDQGVDPAAPRVEVVTAPAALRVVPEGLAPADRIGADDAVTGARIFPGDVELPGMLHGARLRPPRVGASLRSLDLAGAERIPDVTVVHEGDLVGAVAPDPPAARRAVAAMRAEWDLVPQPSESDLVEHLRTHPAEQEGWGGTVREEIGDVEAALAAADVRLEATYTTAYIAHVPLETRVAVARWDGEPLTLWTGTQRPFGVREEVAGRLGIDEALVRVIVPPTCGGFGGKHAVEAAVEAAVFARATGRPVKVRWSRQEEFQWGYLRPAAVIDVRSGAGRDGSLAAWDFRNLNSGSAGLDCPYDVRALRVEFQPAESPLAQGSYRALAATGNAFARESHIDELAAACGVDPVELRVRNLGDERLVDVLRAAADRAGWGDAGVALGIACAVEKDARVATCARVRTDGERAVVEGLVTAFDCGAIVDPDNLANQVEGATVMGLGGALFEAVHFADGCILNGTMTDYRVPRFGDVPAVDVVLVDRPDIEPAGAGETPMIAVAPAIANAIFAATGTRLRSMPLLPEGVVRGDARR